MEWISVQSPNSTTIPPTFCPSMYFDIHLKLTSKISFTQNIVTAKNHLRCSLPQHFFFFFISRDDMFRGTWNWLVAGEPWRANLMLVLSFSINQIIAMSQLGLVSYVLLLMLSELQKGGLTKGAQISFQFSCSWQPFRDHRFLYNHHHIPRQG